MNKIVFFCKDLLIFAKKILRNLLQLLNATFVIRTENKLRGIKTKKIGKVKFEFDFDYNPIYGEMFLQTYQKHIVNILESTLNEGDYFIDIGANIGYISAWAANFVKRKGKVYCFEPVPEIYHKLKRLRDLNSSHQIYLFNVALGEINSKGRIKIANDGNIGWNTLVPGFLKDKRKVKYDVEIGIRKFDNYILNNQISPENITLIKIDTEGYEYPVLLGMRYFLKNYGKPPIICEIAPTAYNSLGYSLKDLSSYMNNCGYSAYSCDKESKIDLDSLSTTIDVYFLAK